MFLLKLSVSIKLRTRVSKRTNSKGNRDSLVESGVWTKGQLETQFHRDIVLPHRNNNSNRFPMQDSNSRPLDPLRYRDNFTTFLVDGVCFNCMKYLVGSLFSSTAQYV
jgi:hypothetical protein